MEQLPKISIVTPSFNQGQFLEQTIQSVINQKYPNLEFIIMDGGSTDNSVDIIKKYEKYLTYWVSKPDNGQTNAIATGFQRSTGDILAYINSDDFYLPGSLNRIALAFASNPSTQWITGKWGIFVDAKGQLMRKRKYPAITINNMLYLENCISQPTTFWRKDLLSSVGYLDETLTFCFDYDLFLRFLEYAKPLVIDYDIAAFRYHSQSKTTTIRDTCIKESQLIQEKYFKTKRGQIPHYFHKIYGLSYRAYRSIAVYGEKIF
jgi:glycosyltransferase involved in cell wall biosynthesis